ncbi:MAG: class I SAM-dependent methyltransferase [SAR202 cluster bacterium]|nr:class I SAM-dependent methyltransferase [SAR202 cluster bacterium]MDP6663006.1 class I SAM-dependent methyltransferase [SAR202 cluster bacterium]
MATYENTNRVAAGSGGSVLVERCQVSGSTDLRSILFVGFLPPVNTMAPIGTRPCEQPAYPAELLYCPESKLVQLGLIVDPAVLFPPHYAYTSGTTRILRENFAELYAEVMRLYPISKKALVVDVGSNDGTLLSNFDAAGHRVCGIEPTDAHRIALDRGIDSVNAFFGPRVATLVVEKHGRAKVVTATNVFAHIENVHEIVESIIAMLDDDGIFISESHYLLPLIEVLQYDTIYHEHQRYYSLQSLQHLLEMHGLEIIHAKRIPTHGGSIRVYASRRGLKPVQSSVSELLAAEDRALTWERFMDFRRRVSQSKLDLMALLKEIRGRGERVYGIGAPSRASTLVNYVGLDDAIVDCVLEIAGSYKIGKMMPGTVIPVLEESKLFADQPEYALLFSWHIADELIPKLKAKGFGGQFILPLPEARIV